VLQGCGRSGCPGSSGALRPLQDLPAGRGQENRAKSPSRRKPGDVQHAKHQCCGCQPTVHAEAAMARVQALQKELQEQARWRLFLCRACPSVSLCCRGQQPLHCCNIAAESKHFAA